jgi:hypothetical protein
MKNSYLFVICASLLVLTGCVSSGSIPVGQDTYMIHKKSAGGIFVSGIDIKIEIIQEGQKYCTSNGKEFKLISSKEQNAVPAQSLPFAEIQFLCLNPNDSRLRDDGISKGKAGSIQMAD